jgi:hypothetical protein
MGFLYRAARIAQGSAANSRGRAAAKRAVANQKLSRQKQADDAMYKYRVAERKGDDLAMAHWAQRLELLGCKRPQPTPPTEPARTGITDFDGIPFHQGEQEIYTRALDYINSCIGHPERVEDARRAAADLNGVAAAVNERIEKFIRDGVTKGGRPWTEDDALASITIED